MTSKHLRLLAGLVLAVSLLAGCGGDGDDAGGDDPTTTEAAPEDDTATTETTADGGDGGETGVTAPAGDPTEPVTNAFTTFFANFAGDPALLEDGESFTAGIDSLRATAGQAGTIAVAVKEVSGLENDECESSGVASPCAEV